RTRARTTGGTVPAKFTLSKEKSGKFRFSLLAPNGQVIATSQDYATKASALNGVASMRKNAAGAALDDQTVAAQPAKTVGAKTTARRTVRKSTARTPARRTAKKA